MGNGTEARVHTLPMCDFCKDEFRARLASYDARTAYGWANMCDDHMAEHGPSTLGIGIGQRFVLITDDDARPMPEGENEAVAFEDEDAFDAVLMDDVVPLRVLLADLMHDLNGEIHE